jgi:hypothetical protein
MVRQEKKPASTFLLEAEIKKKLLELALEDRRNMTSEIEWLVLQEWERRQIKLKIDRQ